LNTGRDNHLWLQCWRDQREDFHQRTANSLLVRFWPALQLPSASRVFVPLCGKSLDMLWLAQQGHHVIGVELSPVAVRAFFEENSLHVKKRRCGDFTLWQSGRISILCGDYFSLRASDIGAIGSIYDRAALTALPADIRQRYIAHQCKIVMPVSTIFLLTIEDAESGDTQEQSFGVDREITALYADTHAIELTHVECIMEDDPENADCSRRSDYKAYRLTSRK